MRPMGLFEDGRKLGRGSPDSFTSVTALKWPAKRVKTPKREERTIKNPRSYAINELCSPMTALKDGLAKANSESAQS
jgi:hypothetical protein